MALPDATFRGEQTFNAAVGEEPTGQLFEPNTFLAVEDMESEDEQPCLRRPQRNNCMLPNEFEKSINQLRLERPGLFAQRQEEEPSEDGTTGLQSMERTSQYDSEATASTSATGPSALMEIQPQSGDMFEAIGVEAIVVEL